MVPNNVVLSVAVVPLREPAAVDLRARLRPDVKPSDIQDAARGAHRRRPLRDAPHIALEEVDGDEVVVRIAATPERPTDGPQLATRSSRRSAPRPPGRTDASRPHPPRGRRRATDGGGGVPRMAAHPFVAHFPPFVVPLNRSGAPSVPTPLALAQVPGTLAFG